MFSFSFAWTVLRRYLRKLWVRVVLLSALSLLAAAVSKPLAPFIPAALTDRFGQEAVVPVLNILASGMLAVTTFSLNVMVSAYRAASSQATPRAYRVLLADTTTQTVLATFVGGFVFSLSAILMFRAGFYDARASVVVFGFTVLIVVLIIVAILRWIEHLSLLGSMDHTLRAIEATARESLLARRAGPALQGVPLQPGDSPDPGAQVIAAPATGYLQLVDMARLQAILAAHDGQVWLQATPGRHLLKGRPLAYATGRRGVPLHKIAQCFTFGDIRSFEQDVRLGLGVLSEIGQRALSPGVNDPATAIEVIARLERLLWEAGTLDNARDPPRFDRVHVPQITADEMLRDSFAPLARDGAGQVEVADRLLQALSRLGAHESDNIRDAARRMGRYVRAHADHALPVQADRKWLQARGYR